MFSIGKSFTSPPVKIIKERKPEYQPKTYSQFIQSVKDKELPVVIVKPNKNIAQFYEENGIMGMSRLFRMKNFGKFSWKVTVMLSWTSHNLYR